MEGFIPAELERFAEGRIGTMQKSRVRQARQSVEAALLGLPCPMILSCAFFSDDSEMLLPCVCRDFLYRWKPCDRIRQNDKSEFVEDNYCG